MDVAHQSLITSSLIIEEQIVINKKKILVSLKNNSCSYIQKKCLKFNNSKTDSSNIQIKQYEKKPQQYNA